jgi:hypothetical protein
MRPRRLLLLAAVTAGAGACANVIGVSGYQDAIEELCGLCDTIDDCEPRLEDALAKASDEEVSTWLQSYADLGCSDAECQTAAFECFYIAPGLCADTEMGEACEISQACCGFFDPEDPANPPGCCHGGGNGYCCNGCQTCGDLVDLVLANGLIPSTDTLCRSHLASWNALLACAIPEPPLAGCTEVCIGPGADPMECQPCLTADCLKDFQACTTNQGR